jgi:uncharacterized repeat protein (TIGR02543 family)
MDKKKIVAIFIFLAMGFFVRTYANDDIGLEVIEVPTEQTDNTPTKVINKVKKTVSKATYTVSFVDGSNVISVKVPAGDPIVAPPDPVHEGETCSWDATADLSKITKDIAVSSVCIKNKVDVIIDPNGGNLPDGSETNKELDYGDSYNFPEVSKYYTLTYYLNGGTFVNANQVNPVTSNVTLLGWCKNSKSCSQANLITDKTIIAKESATYYAIWEDSSNPVTLALAQKATTPTTVYAFKGWTNTNSAQDVNYLSNNINLTNNQDVYAKYNETNREYNLTINYFFEDGDIAATTVTKAIANGSQYLVVSPVITGYTADLTTVTGTMPTNDVVLKVTYKINKYTNTIDPNGGQLPKDVNPNPENNYGTELTLPAASKVYTLTYTLNGGELSSGSTNSVIANVKLLGYCKNSKACATKDLITTNKVTITNGGDTYYAIWDTNSEAIKLAAATKASTKTTDYAFLGWTNNSNNDQNYLAQEITLTSDKTIYAQYKETAHEYILTINYIYSDGTTAKDTYSASVANGANYSVTTPVITGYTADNLVISGTMPTQDVTETVTYTKNSYTNTIDPNGGKLPDDTDDTPTTPYNEDYTFPDATKAYTLTYVLNGGEFVGTQANPVNVPVTLLGWCKNSKVCAAKDLITTDKVKITNGGDKYYAIWATNTNSITLAKATKASTLEYSYRFLGWTLTENGTTYLNNNIVISNDTTVYAHYAPTRINYNLTIYYVYTDGTTALATHSESIANGTSYSVTSPAITGYTADNLVVSGTMPTQDVTATVTYAKDSYTNTIDPNGGKLPEGTDTTPSTPYNEDYTFPTVTKAFALTYELNGGTFTTSGQVNPEVRNLNFLGWCKNSTSCDDTQLIKTSTIKITNGGDTYYAIWADKTDDILLANAKKDQTATTVYTFKGWTNTNDTTDKVYLPNTLALSNNRTIYAKYDESTREYLLTINYKYTNGNVAATSYSATVANGANYSVTSPVITGYTADNLVVSGTMPTNNVTENVTYTKNSYTNNIDPNGGTLPEGTDKTPTTNYGDGYTFPAATKNYTLTYELNGGTFVDASQNTTVKVPVTLLGWCKNNKTCAVKDIITTNKVNITNGGDTYYAIWSTDPINVALVDAKKAADAVNSYSFYGYTNTNDAADTTKISSPIALTGDKTIYAKYTATKNKYTLTINYKYEDGTKAFTSKTYQITNGSTYSYASPAKNGYKASIETVTGTMPTNNLTVDVVYKAYTDLEATVTSSVKRGTTAVTGTNVEYGDEITYTITVKNKGAKAGTIDLSSELANALAQGNVSTPTNKDAQKLLSSAGLTNINVAGLGSYTLTFTVKVTGQVNNTIPSNVTYTLDGTSKTVASKTYNIEKTISINEINTKSTSIVLALDASPSMYMEEYGGSDEKFSNMLTAAKQFINTVFPDGTVQGNSEICLITFPDSDSYYDNNGTAKDLGCVTSTSTYSLTEMKDNLTTDLADESGSGTPYNAAFKLISTKMSTLKTAHPNNDSYVVFLSDGEPTEDNANYNTMATRIKNAGSKIYTIGFETDANANSILSGIASPSSFYQASKSNISTIFQNIAKSINATNKQTTKGVVAISSNINLNKNVIFKVTIGTSTNTITCTNVAQAITQGYIIQNGTTYVVNAAKFAANAKVEVDYYVN